LLPLTTLHWATNDFDVRSILHQQHSVTMVTMLQPPFPKYNNKANTCWHLVVIGNPLNKMSAKVSLSFLLLFCLMLHTATWFSKSGSFCWHNATNTASFSFSLHTATFFLKSISLCQHNFADTASFSLLLCQSNLPFANCFLFVNAMALTSFSLAGAPSNVLLFAVALLFINAMLPKTQLPCLCCCGKLPSLCKLLLFCWCNGTDTASFSFAVAPSYLLLFAIVLLFFDATLPTQLCCCCHCDQLCFLSKFLLLLSMQCPWQSFLIFCYGTKLPSPLCHCTSLFWCTADTQLLCHCHCGKLHCLSELLLLLLTQCCQQIFLIFCHGTKLPSPLCHCTSLFQCNTANTASLSLSLWQAMLS